MGWLWPGFLLLLGLIPLLVAAYIWVLRRRRRYAVRYSSLALVRQAVPRSSSLRRHLPFALFLMALSSLVVALSRPTATVRVPAGQATIILALDVSRSMCSNDIPPNRLAAAKAAALSFIERQQPGVQIGLVAFAGWAELVQAPTNDQTALRAAVEALAPGRGTAVGNGIMRSLEAIAEINPNVAPVEDGLTLGPPALEPPPEGEYASEIIVLLTDGVTTTGVWPLDAAQEAVNRGIRVYTIGFGTEAGSGSFRYCNSPYSSGSVPFSGFGGGGGGGFRRGIDEATLIQISDMTGAAYYSAESAGELHAVFQNLRATLLTRPEAMEISVGFAAIGALLAGLAVVLSLWWHPLP